MQTENILAGWVYGAKYGISDLYDGCADILKNAIVSGKPFYAAWGAKKEIVSATVKRRDVNADIELTVSVGINELSDIADALVWEAAGGNEFAGCGYDAIKKLHPDYDDEHIETIFEELQDYIGDLHQEYFARSTTIAGTATLEDLLCALSGLEELADSESTAAYNAMLAETKNYLKTFS